MSHTAPCPDLVPRSLRAPAGSGVPGYRPRCSGRAAPALEVPGPRHLSSPRAPLQPRLCSVVPTLSSGCLKTVGVVALGEGTEMHTSDGVGKLGGNVTNFRPESRKDLEQQRTTVCHRLGRGPLGSPVFPRLLQGVGGWDGEKLGGWTPE